MQAILDTFINCDSEEKLSSAVAKYTDACNCFKQLLASAKKARNLVQGKVRVMQTKSLAEARKLDAAAVKREEDRVKQQAKEAAERVKLQEHSIPPIFTLSFKQLETDKKLLHMNYSNEIARLRKEANEAQSMLAREREVYRRQQEFGGSASSSFTKAGSSQQNKRKR